MDNTTEIDAVIRDRNGKILEHIVEIIHADGRRETKDLKENDEGGEHGNDH